MRIFALLKFTYFPTLLKQCKVMIQIELYKDKRQGNANCGKVYGRVKNAKPIGLDKLAEHMVKHNTPYSAGTLRGILTDLVHCIRELCLMGQPIKLENLCIISAQVTSTPADDVESFELDSNIKNARLRFTACGESTPAEVTKNSMLAYTSLAERVKKGEITLSNKKGEYIATDGDEPVVNP